MCVSDDCPFVRGCRLKVSNLDDVNDDNEGRNAMQRIYAFILVCLNEKDLVENFPYMWKYLGMKKQIWQDNCRHSLLATKLFYELVNLIEPNCIPSAQRPPFDSTMLWCGLGYLMQIRVKYRKDKFDSLCSFDGLRYHRKMWEKNGTQFAWKSWRRQIIIMHSKKKNDFNLLQSVGSRPAERM